MAGSVLVLNATYEPLNVVSVQRAVVLLLKEKAQIVESTEAWIRAQNWSIPQPLVIRLVYYVRIPHRLSLPLGRRTVLARDGFSCQYCGRQPERSELTLDHVLPRCRGGKSSWENLVAACRRCNGRKGDRTPHEAGMPLRSQPFAPRYIAVTIMSDTGQHEVWSRYIH
ncbi:MAG TPA: HNH endonuclease [Anaerolineae bacterium]|jgi:5-methylcytosine-specific restriction endonuclease McrA|nr:HNH endonuclease [Anaerolineae bacterium]